MPIEVNIPVNDVSATHGAGSCEHTNKCRVYHTVPVDVVSVSLGAGSYE